jgi:hypothetical protein
MLFVYSRSRRRAMSGKEKLSETITRKLGSERQGGSRHRRGTRDRPQHGPALEPGARRRRVKQSSAEIHIVAAHEVRISSEGADDGWPRHLTLVRIPVPLLGKRQVQPRRSVGTDVFDHGSFSSDSQPIRALNTELISCRRVCHEVSIFGVAFEQAGQRSKERCCDGVSCVGITTGVQLRGPCQLQRPSSAAGVRSLAPSRGSTCARRRSTASSLTGEPLRR